MSASWPRPIAPWPWIVADHAVTVRDADGIVIAGLAGDTRQRHAHASLIAAAPEVAQSAAAFVRWFKVFIGDDTYAQIDCIALNDLRAALEKAGKGL